jgi:hypothetical protein
MSFVQASKKKKKKEFSENKKREMKIGNKSNAVGLSPRIVYESSRASPREIGENRHKTGKEEE